MQNKKVGLILCLFDVAALLLGVVLAGLFYKFIAVEILDNTNIELTPALFQQRLSTFIFESIAIIFIFFNRGHYSRIIPWWSQVKYITLVLFVMLIIDGFIYFALKNQFSRIWTIITWFNVFTLLLIGRYCARYLSLILGIWKVPVVIVGGENNVLKTLYALSTENYIVYDINALILSKIDSIDFIEQRPNIYKNVPILNLSHSDLELYIKKNPRAFYILAPDTLEDQKIDELISNINKLQAWCALAPPLEGAPLYGTIPQYFFGNDVMFLFARNPINSPFGNTIKRFLDIIGGTVGLICLLPIFLVLVLIVKKDGGPAFFAHTRIGKNNKPFKCFKFRTMAVNAEEQLRSILQSDKKLQEEWDQKQKLDSDPRITKIGHFLRKTSVDELPQLVNIIKGEMSLVGPRPITAEEKKHYAEKIDDYLSVRPGLTGLWQVSGRSDTSYKHRVHLDSWYVNNWSLWNDIVIICKTIIITLKGKGAR